MLKLVVVVKQPMQRDNSEKIVPESDNKNEKLYIVESSPQGRFVRFNQILGRGSFKIVFRSWDSDLGLEVAWNVVDVRTLNCSVASKRVIQEMKMLQSLSHPNILKFYASWVNKENQTLNFVTEMISSGSLKEFINARPVRLNILKRWCISILDALEYLHRHDPPIIHRDLKCDNIFINGSTGDIRIGDLGLATWERTGNNAQSVLGTPEYMAPELYDEDYDEKVDIYAFGMCVAEIVSKICPYEECANVAQIFRKVSRGVMPHAFVKIRESPVKGFIRRCISSSLRPSASELLMDRFLVDCSSDKEFDCYEFFNPLCQIIEVPITPVKRTSISLDDPTIVNPSTIELVTELKPNSSLLKVTVKIQYDTKRINVSFVYDVNESPEDTVQEMINENCFPRDFPQEHLKSIAQRLEFTRTNSRHLRKQAQLVSEPEMESPFPKTFIERQKPYQICEEEERRA